MLSFVFDECPPSCLLNAHIRVLCMLFQVLAQLMQTAFAKAEYHILIQSVALSHWAMFAEDFTWVVAEVPKDPVWALYFVLDSSYAAGRVLIDPGTGTDGGGSLPITPSNKQKRADFASLLDDPEVPDDPPVERRGVGSEGRLGAERARRLQQLTRHDLGDEEFDVSDSCSAGGSDKDGSEEGDDEREGDDDEERDGGEGNDAREGGEEEDRTEQQEETAKTEGEKGDSGAAGGP